MAPPSPFKCACGQASPSPVCPACGSLVDLPENLSHFEVLGISENLKLDAQFLRDQFYSLSKRTHPDRYATKDARSALAAARWSTAVNRAYQTLKNPESRALYLLERANLPNQQSGVPLELAETYFELQDLLAEPGGQESLSRFDKEISKKLTELENQWPVLEAEWEKTEDKKKILEEVAKHFTLRRFLHSMLSDLRKKAE